MEGEEYWPLGQFEPGRAAAGWATLISVSTMKNYATEQANKQANVSARKVALIHR